MNFLRTSSYKSLQQSEDGINQPSSLPSRFSNLHLYIGWLLACVFAFSTGFLLYQSPEMGHHQKTSPASSFSTGFGTEFDPIKSHIKEESKMFWGGPRWYDNGTGYHVRNPSEPVYVGPPTDEMDDAWHNLLTNRYFNITEEEAELTFGKPHGLYKHPDGIGYLIGLDVYHTLHCVEQLRRALDRDHYFNKETKLAYPDRAHRDHCLDHIRQQLMCHVDLTPIPVIWYEGHGRSFVQSDVVHTCRNWDAVQQFISSRS
ncbi:hypothetical protein OIDMADRAFT_133628 [Oidiodendron maius Zn]|uniref:Uncharacterized protein n=1 Tax=Oidiodendron maius (strain Zn) TaxID=913774 RepID=A0A0C3GHC6_OIDMZ|nr:hypothetical protein OIDMADRAFT_133628 [Oidiodendron maius Zn]